MGQREALLLGAQQCIAEKGYARTTARDIAAASGANLAAIGYHFGSKEALLSAAIIAAMDELGDAIEAALPGPESVGAEARFELFLDRFLSELGQRRSTMVSSVQAFGEAEFSALVHEQLASAFDDGARGLAAMLLGISLDDVEEADRPLGSFLLALLNGMVLQWLINPDSAPSATQLTAAMKRLVAGPAGVTDRPVTE